MFSEEIQLLYIDENTVVGEIFSPDEATIKFYFICQHASWLGMPYTGILKLKKVHPPSVSQQCPDKRSSQVITNAMSTPESVCLQWTSAHAADHVTGHHRCQTMHSTVTTEFIALRKSLQP